MKANLIPFLCLLALVRLDAADAPVPAAAANDWPRTIQYEGVTGVVYQPQLEQWDGFTLSGRAAVSIKREDTAQPVFGVIHLTARTLVNREERTVHFEDLTVVEAEFPSVPYASPYLKFFQSSLAKDIPDMDLDRLEASLAILKARARPQAIRNDPPAVVFATQPTMLIALEGEPQWAAVGQTGLDRVLNTRVLLLRDAGGSLYLHLYDGYVTARALAGPWVVAPSVPAPVNQAQEQLVAAKQVDLLAGQADPATKENPTLARTGAPALLVVTKPTELVVTEGEPKWTPIPGTKLLFVENTPAHVFKHLGNQQTYLLVSGRWFRGAGLAGPWAHVPGQSLPADFAAIPDDSPQENVKAAVPGTHQAEEALIANSIPTTSKLDRKTAKLSPAPAYDGAPKLETIPGTTLAYATNSAIPVIRVDDYHWYACSNGVWFTSGNASGPWLIAGSVPPVIYGIPPSSPLYYVTYVRVYRADDDYVWVGYTPGYYGTVIGESGTVVYGTGYLYSPYVSSSVYVSYPSTYGYGVTLSYTPWTGWAYGFSVGWAWGAAWGYWACCPPAPYWGPYWGWCYGAGYNAWGGVTAWGPYGWAGTSGNIYSRHGPWSGVSRVNAGFDAWTGNHWTSQYGHAYNSRTGTRVAGQRGAVENVYTGNYAAGGRGVAHNDATGITAAGSHGTIGNAYTGREISGGHGTIYNPNTGNATRVAGIHGDDGGIVRVGDHVVAGHDGNVYSRNSDGTWDQLNRPSGLDGTRDRGAGRTASASEFDSFNRTYESRQAGAQRAESFRGSRDFAGGGRLRR